MVYLISEFSRVILQNLGCSLKVDFKRVRISRTVIMNCRVGTTVPFRNDKGDRKFGAGYLTDLVV